MLADEHARRARVVEVDVAEQQVPEVPQVQAVPVEAFDAVVPGATPVVVFARGPQPDEIEFVASEAVVVTELVPA